MPLTPIPLKSVIRTEAVAPKTYDSMWIRTLQIRTPTPDMSAGSIYIEYVPMRSGAGETLDSQPIEIRSDRLWEAAATVPEVATAVGALLAAIRPLEGFIDNGK